MALMLARFIGQAPLGVATININDLLALTLVQKFGHFQDRELEKYRT